jgi:hypothetical protein
MSRGQQSAIISTADKNSATDTGNAASSLTGANSSINNYDNSLASFVSGNPYTQGGQYDQTINSGLANTSDAGSNSLKGALQSQALRTGQNSAADAATASSGAQANTRALSSDMATAQQGRINSQTGYNTTALNAGQVPISANSSLYGTSLSGGEAALNTAAGSSQTPGFWDTLGDSFGSALGKTAGGGNQGNG